MIDLEQVIILRDRINTLDEQVNQRVASAEEKIKTFGFGVRCFINLNDKHYSFGFSKEDRGWGLYLKKENKEEKIYQIWKLESAPRIFRIACLEKMEELEEALIKAAEAHIERVEKFLMGK